MKKTILAVLLFSGMLPVQNAKAQFFKKLKEKAAQAVEKKVAPSSDNSTTTTSDNNSSSDESQSNSSPGNKPINKGGGGLKNTTPPDVSQQMTDAEAAHAAAKYSDARYSIQQALVGVEIQLGREILRDLPATVVNLPKDTLQDKVVSTQWGWNNLTMQRIYTDQKDKQLTVTIGNNAMYAGVANLYFNNAYGMQADANNQNIKQTKVKGNKAIIEYSDSKGYTLMVPIGQSSMIVWECINFADENEVMAAANTFDIDGIKKSLGEQ